MSHDHSALIGQLRELLTHQRFSPVVIRNYCRSAEYFLEYLSRLGVPVEKATPAQVSSYLYYAIRRFKRCRGRAPAEYWHSIPRAGIHALLRMVQGKWPHAADCERLGRTLAKARHHLDPSIPVPKRDRLPQQQVARQWRRPHIYSPEEICHLLDIARRYPSPRSPLRPLTLYTMLVVGYCAGLRAGEIARLNLGDVDLEAGTITIRETKFFKSRILPLAGSVVAALRKYLDARRRAGGPQDPASGLFWHEQGAQRYGREAIAWLFVDILRRAGLKPPRGKNGPRVHDLRHSMVVNRILAWYRAGINPQDRLPFLATYLGHRDIHSTLVYITVTQDLLQEAGERFRALGARCLQVAEGTRP